MHDRRWRTQPQLRVGVAIWCLDLLYAAWHDPAIKDEHARRLAEQSGLLVRAGPLLNAGTAILAPDHLPGSWNPRPGWRKPRSGVDRVQVAAWAGNSRAT